MTTFSSLGLAEPIQRALTEERYETPTPIQAKAIPPVLEGRDLIGIAQTGTGKTAAFALPILHRLAGAPARPEPKACRVLVLAPTRELGAQIVDAFHAYGRHVPLKTTLAIGGVPIGKQRRALQNGVDVLVATPGRLLDLHKTRAVRLDAVEVLVLDEADRMLDMGFIHDIRRIVGLVPAKRQTLFFSATMPTEIRRLADDMLSDPVTVAVTPAATTVQRIAQSAIRVEKGGKPGALATILSDTAVERAVVFARTKHGADRVARGLAHAGIPAEAIHGDKTQGNRERTMAAFRKGSIRILVATDIAARGIDVDGVSHVVNYDLPNIAETYVHRIGRTARAGAEGTAISLVSRDEMPFLRDIEKLIRQPVAFVGEAPAEVEAARARPADDERQTRRGRGRNQRRRGRNNGDAPRPEGTQGKNRRRQKYGDKPAVAAGPSRNATSRPEAGIAGVGFMSRPSRPHAGMEG